MLVTKKIWRKRKLAQLAFGSQSKTRKISDICRVENIALLLPNAHILRSFVFVLLFLPLSPAFQSPHWSRPFWTAAFLVNWLPAFLIGEWTCFHEPAIVVWVSMQVLFPITTFFYLQLRSFTCMHVLLPATLFFQARLSYFAMDEW